MDDPRTLDRVVSFLNEIGIPTTYKVGAAGFTEGCRIEKGTLTVDPDCRISALLHEAAHLAITPSCFRALMDGDLYAGQREMLRIVKDAGLHPDGPLYRAVIQCTDPEATAWAWAAGVALGIEAESIIRDDDYEGDGESIRWMLRAGMYYGIHGLAHAGFCRIRARDGVKAFPHLNFWTQEFSMGSISELNETAVT